MNKAKDIVPVQITGGKSLTRHIVRASDQETAIQLFQKAKANLLNVNCWQELAGPASAAFQLMNNQGDEVPSPVRVGHFIRISIPMASATTTGDGYDWVKVEKVEGDQQLNYEWIAIRVRPAPVPFLLTQKPPHFFSEDASSSFIIERKGLKIIGAVYGRNEKPNTKTPGVINKLRNFFVAIAAIVGLNKPQWKTLAKGWLLH